MDMNINKTTNYIILICVLIGLFLLPTLVGYQKSVFGRETGANLFEIELVVFGLFGFSGYLIRKGNINLSKSLLFLSISIIFFTTGWHVQSSKVIERASNRVIDIEYGNLEIKQQLEYATDDEKEQTGTYMDRWRTELSARKLELSAAQVRHNGDQNFFKSKFHVYIFWLFSLAMLANSSLFFMKYWQHNKQNPPVEK